MGRIGGTPNRSTNSDWSEINDSENSQILYMASFKKSQSRAARQSLSSISNKSSRSLDKSQLKSARRGIDGTAEELAWTIIDREIFEWQYVCRTGRPYWWSPESKYCRLKKLQPALFHSTRPQIWLKEVHDNTKPGYDFIRRAVSDGYLAEPGTVEDLAQMIAVQLLSACFTIPPDNLGIPSPTYSTLDNPKLFDAMDTRLISSLRMHTHFRYSPAFGFQARNTSPVESWPITYDGPHSSQDSPPGDKQTPELGTSQPSSRRRRVHRALHITEGSMSGCSYGSHEDDVIDKYGLRTDLANVADNFLPEIPPARQRQPWPTNRSVSYPLQSEVRDEEVNTAETYRSAHTSRPTRWNHLLHPMISSDPHPVYVQPVKELVVRKLRKLRRRVGGSLHSLHPGDAAVGASRDSISDSRLSTESSSKMSSDGKERRRLARQRGDILSSSTECTPHFNLPMSIKTPDASRVPTPHAPQSPRHETTDHRALMKSGEAGRGLTPLTHHSQTSFSSPPASISLWFESRVTVPNAAESATIEPKSQRRRNRRSRLSEVCTPDYFSDTTNLSLSCLNIEGDKEAVERSIFSALGSALASPKSEKPPTSDPSTSSFPQVPLEAGKHDPRPWTRMNSTGTALFTPDRD